MSVPSREYFFFPSTGFPQRQLSFGCHSGSILFEHRPSSKICKFSRVVHPSQFPAYTLNIGRNHILLRLFQLIIHITVSIYTEKNLNTWYNIVTYVNKSTTPTCLRTLGHRGGHSEISVLVVAWAVENCNTYFCEELAKIAKNERLVSLLNRSYREPGIDVFIMSTPLTTFKNVPSSKLGFLLEIWSLHYCWFSVLQMSSDSIGQIEEL
jgi:hypothetical protein